MGATFTRDQRRKRRRIAGPLQDGSIRASSSMEGSGGDFVGSGRMPEWELKANSWEWENLTMVYPRQQQQELGSNNNNNNVISHHQRLPQNNNNDWASAVTLATSPTGSPKTGSFSIGLGSGCSTPSDTSVSRCECRPFAVGEERAGCGALDCDRHAGLVKCF